MRKIVCKYGPRSPLNPPFFHVELFVGEIDVTLVESDDDSVTGDDFGSADEVKVFKDEDEPDCSESYQASTSYNTFVSFMGFFTKKLLRFREKS